MMMWETLSITKTLVRVANRMITNLNMILIVILRGVLLLTLIVNLNRLFDLQRRHLFMDFVRIALFYSQYCVVM